MAQHGYLGDNYGSEYDPNYDDDGSDRDDRRWRSESRQDWRGEDHGRRSFMFDDRSGGSDWNDDEGRGGRARNWRGSDAREWFGGRPGIRDDRWQGDRNRASSHPDDHYRSWRDKQMQALDRDYEDYCREREQQFHQEFDSWRQSREQQNLGLRAPWGPEQGNGADEQTFTPQTTAVSNTMTTSETHEPQTTTEPDRIATVGTTARKR
jgi:hypothetical protein